MDEKKYKSIIALWGIILLTLQALALIDAVGLRPEIYTHLSKLMTSFIASGMIVVVITYMFLALNKKIIGHILGIIIGVLYISTLNIFNIIAGVCFIIYCIVMMRSLKKE